ncbi:MAG: efflux RND transporter permease subunit [Firmicutes bacterium]|nr:efflux RND transporter permease subunit [Bacillota bacterium]
MKRLIEIAVKDKKIVLFIAVVIAVLGLYSYHIVPKQENPHIKVTGAVVTTIYPGASPQDVEQLVTKKIEDAASQLSQYQSIWSDSEKNVSIVVVLYKNEADIDKANQSLREKIDEIKDELPSACQEPKIDTDLAEVAGMMISLSGDHYTYEQLSSYGEALEDVVGEIDGIYKTELIGNVAKQVIVEVAVDRLNQLDISLDEVANLLYLQNLEVPNGAIENEREKIFVKAPALYQSLDDIENIIITVSAETGAVVKLGDVAKVYMGLQDDVKKCKQGQRNAVIVAGYFDEDKNILATGKKVREALEDIKKDLPEDLTLTESAYQPDDVERSIDDFLFNLMLGMLLVIIVIFMGMGFRNAVVVSLCIPFSIMITFILMNVTDVRVQSISLTGLIIALGIIVDNAIVISDGINVRYANGESKETAAINATASASVPIFTSTLTTVAAFAPLLFIGGDAGRFLASLPKVVIYALTASFLVAVFVIPPMLSMVIGEKNQKEKKEGVIKEGLLRLLKLGLKRKGITVMVALLLFAATIGLIMPRLKVAFFPKADKDLMYVDTFVEKVGDIRHTEKVANRIYELLSQEPEVTGVTTGIGTAMPRFYITIPFYPDREHYTRALLNFDLTKSDRFNTANELAIYLQEKLDSEAVGASATLKMLELTDPEASPVEIRLFGEDMTRLKDVAEQLENILKDMPATVNVKNGAGENTYTYIVDVDSDKASSMGILNSDVQQQLHIALFGNKDTVYRKAGKEYDIEVRSDIDSIGALKNLKIKSSITGQKVLLKQIADIKLEPQVDNIKRYNKKRSIFVTCDVKPGYSAVDVANDIEHQKLKDINTDGVKVVFAGEREQIANNFMSLGVMGIFILLLMYIILLIQFNSFIEPIIILITVPLSLIGSMLGLFLFRKPLSFTALLGVVSLMGIVVNNGILLIEYIKEAKKQGYCAYDACVNSVSLRFRPIMLSTITTLMGLMPLAVSDSDLFSPMAITLMSGLLVSTLLTMLVIPVIYMAVDRFGHKVRGSNKPQQGAV